MREFIPVNTPMITMDDQSMVCKALEEGWVSSEGPYVKRFEECFRKYFDKEAAISCSSGTAALDIAFASIGLKKGDEVIVPDFTIISCANAVVRAGGVPVFVDACREDWNIDIGLLKQSITEKTRVILVVHIYGLPSNMDEVMSLAEQHNLIVIEDCAEYLGGRYREKLCGTFGDLAIFSFYPNKNITTGEGGMIITDDSGIAERCRWYRNLCFESEERFVHYETGWNYRLTSLQAALGISQMQRLDATIKIKREIGCRYWEAFKDIDECSLAPNVTDQAENQYWIFGIVLGKGNMLAKAAIYELSRRGIGCRPFFYPLSLQPVFLRDDVGRRKGVKGVSEWLYNYGFYIPSGLGLTIDQQNYVIDSVKELISEQRYS